MSNVMEPYRCDVPTLRAMIHNLESDNRILENRIDGLVTQLTISRYARWRPRVPCIGLSLSFLAFVGQVSHMLAWPVFDTISLAVCCIGLVGFTVDLMGMRIIFNRR